MKFSTGQTVSKTSLFRLADFHYNSLYKVLDATLGYILIQGESGAEWWVESLHFTIEPKKKSPSKMTHGTPQVGCFIIGSLHPQNGFSDSAKPQRHLTEDSARAECERLAAKHPEKKFVYLEVKGACHIPSQVWE